MNISIGATLSQLRKDKMLTQKALAARLSVYGFDVKTKTIYNWEKELSQPNIPNFIALCDILDVDDVLWQFAGIPKGPYAGLNPGGRQKAREFIDLLFQIDAYKIITGKGDISARTGNAAESESVHDGLFEEASADPFGQTNYTPRILRLYDIPVSAGTGNFLDDSGYEDIEVPSYVPVAVDFALRVSGDSMEPLLCDGQVIWVKEQEVLDSGDIGIFTYSGDVYCKKLIADGTKAYLRSLNPVYGDIEIFDDYGFKVIGKVV